MYQTYELRLVGKCPQCLGLNVLSGSRTDSDRFLVRCDFCTFSLILRGNLRDQVRQIPGVFDGFILKADARKVIVRRPFGDGHLPFRRLMATYLNTALRLKFKLSIAIATEGGVEGSVDHKPITLLNWDGSGFGLEDDHPVDANPGFDSLARDRVIAWYAGLLRLLFMQPFHYRGETYAVAEIVGLKEESIADEERAAEILLAVIGKYSHGRLFAPVQDAIDRTGAGPPHLAPLTDDQITRLHVDPPYH